MFIQYSNRRSQKCLQYIPRHWRNIHIENITLLGHAVTKQHGTERLLLPHSIVAHSHQLKHGRALNNSKHTSQLESAEKTYQRKKKLVLRIIKEMLTEGECIKTLLKTNLLLLWLNILNQ